MKKFVLFLSIFILGRKMGEAASRESLWIRDRSLDGLTSNSGVLWVQEGSVSYTACAQKCLDSDDCDAVFYNSRTLECQGHNGDVTLSGTTTKLDNVLYSKVTMPGSSTPPSPPVRVNNPNPAMVYDVYVDGLMSWYDAEATCDSLGQRLIRLDTPKRLNAVIGFLGVYPATRNRDVYVGGIVCCLQIQIYWHSGQQDYWKDDAGIVPSSMDRVYKVNTGISNTVLQLHTTPSDQNMFVCETIP